MMNGYRKRRKPMAEINVVPYIDVMLVLLIIFMITTPLLSQGVKVDLPKVQAKALSSKEREPIIVSVDAKGNYYLNISEHPLEPISVERIHLLVGADLQLSKTQQQTRNVLVKGDRNVNYGKVVQAMVILQQAGAEKVGLMTEKRGIN